MSEWQIIRTYNVKKAYSEKWARSLKFYPKQTNFLTYNELCNAKTVIEGKPAFPQIYEVIIQPSNVSLLELVTKMTALTSRCRQHKNGWCLPPRSSS